MAEGRFTREIDQTRVALFYPHTAPTTEDITLTERDAKDMFEELVVAMNKAYELGLVLKLLPHELDAIRKTYPDPRECLLQVILSFLRQAKPRPTWKVIVDALRSPAVNLTALAERVEAAHFPDPAATRSPPPATSESVTDWCSQVMRCVYMPVPPTASVQTSTTEPAQQISITPENSEKNKSPAVNLTAQDEGVEAAHFPTRPPPPATGESVTRQIGEASHEMCVCYASSYSFSPG